MWLSVIILFQLQPSFGELAAFGRGAPSRPTIVSSAQYRSFIMPKIFGGEPNEADAPTENSVSECPEHRTRYSNRPAVSSNCHFHRLSNYYYNQSQKPVASVSPYQPSLQSMAYPVQHGQFQTTLQSSYGQNTVSYWHTTTPHTPTNVEETQPTHYYHRYTNKNQLGQHNAAHIPSYLEAIPLPRFQPAAMVNQMVQRRSNGVVNKDDSGCCPFSPFSRFLTMEQQEALHELIVQARNSGAEESAVSQLMDRYVREILPRQKFAKFLHASKKFNREREERMHRGKHNATNLTRRQKSVPERIEINNSQRDLFDFLNKPTSVRKLKELEKIE